MPSLRLQGVDGPEDGRRCTHSGDGVQRGDQPEADGEPTECLHEVGSDAAASKDDRMPEPVLPEPGG